VDVFGAPAVRPFHLAAWVLGFLAYHWLHEPPLGPSWWVDLVERTSPPELGIGASLPAFVLSFGLTLLATSVRQARAEPSLERS
jgi:hypothetical protein